MLDAVASEAAARLTDFNPQELSNLLVAYARAHNPPEHYLNIRLLEVRSLRTLFRPMQQVCLVHQHSPTIRLNSI